MAAARWYLRAEREEVTLRVQDGAGQDWDSPESIQLNWRRHEAPGFLSLPG